jgi:PAS domain S-box-containing protein
VKKSMNKKKLILFIILLFLFSEIYIFSLNKFSSYYTNNEESIYFYSFTQKVSLSLKENLQNSQALNIISNFLLNQYYLIAPFFQKNKEFLGISALSILILLIILNSFVNLKKRKNLEKNLKKEYLKLDKRVEESTLKLHLTNEHLQEEITRYKDTEKHLLQIKEAVETMKLGVTITDKRGKILCVNPANARMHGYKPEELVGKFSSVFTSEVLREEIDLDKIKEWQGKIRRSVNIKRDGSIFQVQLVSDLVKDDKGEILAIVTTCEDITQRTQAEEALKTSEENFRRIFDNIQDIYYEVDIDGIIKEISPSVNTISNFNREELIGKPMVNLYTHAKQRDNFLKALKKDEKVHDYEIMLKGKENNTSIPCSVTAKLILDDSGLPLKIIGSMRNITDRKLAEAKQTQILKDLTQANKELRDFSYVTSHDLKSPLRAINTLANWIFLDYADKFDDKAKEQMNLLLGRVERMHQLIEGIFQFSSLGSYLGKEEKVDLNSLVNTIIEKIKPPKGIKINIDAELPTITFEKERIEQVFEHLLKNAVQFMKKETGKISIDCTEEEGKWKFNVTDTGPGIAKKYHDQIFEMFKTLQSRDDLETSGIGLTIVKKIIEMNEGKIWVESKVGIGTTLYFTIPKTKKIKTNPKN